MDILRMHMTPHNHASMNFQNKREFRDPWIATTNKSGTDELQDGGQCAHRQQTKWSEMGHNKRSGFISARKEDRELRHAALRIWQ